MADDRDDLLYAMLSCFMLVLLFYIQADISATEPCRTFPYRTASHRTVLEGALVELAAFCKSSIDALLYVLYNAFHVKQSMEERADRR